MSNNAVGLNFQEEFEAAAEQEGLAGPPPAPASVEPVVIEPASEEEQPAVETEEEASVFSDLASEETDDEQPEEDSHEVTVSGESFNVSLSELIDGYQRHADYTRGKQEIADMKKEHSNAITLWEALEGDYAGTVQKLDSRDFPVAAVNDGCQLNEQSSDHPRPRIGHGQRARAEKSQKEAPHGDLIGGN